MANIYDIASAIIADRYAKELSPAQEKTVKAVSRILVKTGVVDEMVRARALSQKNSFLLNTAADLVLSEEQ
jgi:hypothetical protein